MRHRVFVILASVLVVALAAIPVRAEMMGSGMMEHRGGGMGMMSMGPMMGMGMMCPMCGGPMGPTMGGMMPGMMGRQGFLLDLSRYLQLTGEQMRKLKQLRLDTQKTAIKKSVDIRIAELELQSMLAAEMVDMNAVQRKVKTISDLRSDLRMVWIEAHEKAKNILTEKQRKMLMGPWPAPSTSSGEAGHMMMK